MNTVYCISCNLIFIDLLMYLCIYVIILLLLLHFNLIAGNDITGTIPSEIGLLTALKFFIYVIFCKIVVVHLCSIHLIFPPIHTILLPYSNNMQIKLTLMELFQVRLEC